ncbi:hypothetical protein cypCar_00048648 [Cyprinus carpio]|nr:hypothetical protein cypCar_00048648 [Cyprinus carpio]
MAHYNPSVSSPSDEVNLGVSVNPHDCGAVVIIYCHNLYCLVCFSAKPTDFDFLAVIGKGTFGKVRRYLINCAPHKNKLSELSCQLQVLLAKLKADGKFYAVKVLQKKVILKKKELISVFSCSPPSMLRCVLQQKNIMAERNVLLKSLKHPFLVGLHYSFQTAEKLYFVLDYVNGGEVWEESITYEYSRHCQ